MRMRHTISITLVSALLISCLSWAFSSKAQDKGPPYPRVSLATWYEVDPQWPQRPDGVHWGHVPGIAVDAKDQVWVYTRAIPPVQVYTTDGKFVRSWGQDDIMTAHHIKFDRSRNV